MKAASTHPLNFAFRVPFHPDVTERQTRRAGELWAGLENAERLAAERRASEHAAEIGRRNDELRRALGADHFFALQQFKRALQLEAAGKRGPVAVTSEVRADLSRRQKRRVRRFLTARGLSADRVAAAVTGAFAGITSPFDTDFVGEITDTVFEEPPPPGPNAFRTFTPPYTGFGTGYVEGALGFRFEHDNFIDPEEGQVGLAIRLDDRNAREHDHAFMRRSSMVAFWFRAPLRGIVEVFTDYQCIQARHKLTVDDRFGFSSAQVVQKHLLSMQVVHPNVAGPTFTLAGQLTYDGDDDVSVDHRHLPGGHRIQTRMTSNGVVGAGEMVLVAVGCRSEDEARSNDMEVHSESIYSWFIPRVRVRILE